MFKQNILILTIALSLILSINLVASQDFTFKLNEEINFTMPCTSEGLPCSTLADCNATIRNRNNTYIIQNKQMTNLGDGDFIIPINFTTLDTKTYKVNCVQGGSNGTRTGEIFITPTGRIFTESQGIGALGILAGALTLSFIFLIIGFRLEANPSTMPIGFLFVILALVLGIYSLHLGYVYSNDILQYESLVPVTSAVYLSVLFSVVGIAILSSALMLIAFIKEISNTVKQKKFGVGFDPLTNTYE